MYIEEEVIQAIRLGKPVFLLLYEPDSTLSHRAMSMMDIQESKMRSYGCEVYRLPIREDPIHEEFSCVRAPQLRFFVKGKLETKIVGVFDDSSLSECLKVM